MLRQLKNNDGVVFVTVLAVIITMMVLAVSIISMNVSQTMISEEEVKRAKAEILATGALTYFYANQLSNTPSDSIAWPMVTLDNINYNITMDMDTTGTGPPDSESLPLSINVEY